MERRITLYKREGSADKVYSLEMTAAAGDLWDVRFRNARRGQPLKLAKELLALALDKANEAFDKQEKAKKKDGYTESQDGQAYTSSEFAGRRSGVLPQLPNPIDESRAWDLVHDDEWALQEKANGENRILIVDGHEVRGTNKKGLFVDIPESWVVEFRALGNVTLAGEHVEDTYYAFDLLAAEGQDLRDQPFSQRYARLAGLLAGMENVVPSLRLLNAYFQSADKREELARIEAAGGEGGVFKRRAAAYAPGYSDASLKYKFRESSACLVLARNQQRSVQIGLYGADGAVIPVGNVTIPTNAAMPEAGEIAEVEYLYYNPGGAFEQPVFLHTRRDMEPAECVIGQVRRYKPEVLQRERERQSQ